MKIKIYFLSYLAQFFLKWDVSGTNFWECQNTHFISNNFISKIVPLWDHMEKCCMAQTTMRMSTAWWIPKNTGTHSEYIILNALPLQQSYVIDTSTLLLSLKTELNICLQTSRPYVWRTWSVYSVSGMIKVTAFPSAALAYENRPPVTQWASGS
jgi:hypothetical protein